MSSIKECSSVYGLANHLNLNTATITNILYNVKTDNCYKEFVIPKKNGGKRIICAPNPELKSIQKRLANALYYELDQIRKKEGISAKISHAFEKNKSIISNCEIHKRKRFVLNVDLKDFFDHFHYGRVYGYFIKNKNFLCTDEIARTIANLACFKSKLPQGAPTSPIITNLIFQTVDIRILQLTRKYRLDYTRYADDLTFSTNRKDFLEVYKDFLNELGKLLKRSGFEINDNKIRISFRDSRQTVTGLVVNKKINVCADYYKLVRAYANSFYKNGEYNIKDKNDKDSKKGTANQLEGMLSFIHMIDRHNSPSKTQSDPIKQQKSLNKRDREYQRFLFYKYFYKNDRPLIITEGKTDQIYLKCALKKYYRQFPKLIKKTDKGFQFNVQFFKRSQIMLEMFSFVKDGADAMSNFYKNFYATKVNKIFPDYYQYFTQITNQSASNPVLFVFDNEVNNDSKPLSNFIRLFEKKKTSVKDAIIENGWIRVVPNKNLYVVTHQLVDSKNECEIEDLFTKDTLELEVNGKTFSRENNYDINEHFGKDHFSKIIAKQYEHIDFSNFIPFLERIQNAISDYYDNNN
jgi:hypothetical protein